jgi:hypothetical protein
MSRIGLVIAGAVLVASWGTSRADTASSPVSVSVPAAVTAKANAAKAPASATKKTSIGKGKTAANTSNAAGDDDSFWVEDIDVDGDGNTESTSILWDDEDKVLLLYADGDFTCRGGGTGAGDMLILVNGQGNPRGRPAGSGWYVVTLDEDECKAEEAGSFGCRFDAKGNATACGAAGVDEKNDEITIATATE